MLLGEARFTASSVVFAITEDFPFHVPPVDQTTFFRRALDSLGRSLNYKVVCGESGRRRGEPSLDLTWWEPGTGIVLAACCEWGVAGDVAAAFGKLMTVKAPVKLLIFRSRRAGAERQDILLRTDIDAVLKAVGAALLDFAQHLEGELYLLVERVEQDSRFRTYEFRVPANGKLALPFAEAARVFRCREACVAAASR